MFRTVIRNFFIAIYFIVAGNSSVYSQNSSTPLETILAFLQSEQTWTIKDVLLDTKDLQARTQKREDLNGDPCALLKIEVPKLKDITFEGNYIGETQYTPGEYLVYVPAGTKRIKLKHEDYTPLVIEFSDCDIKIEQQSVYKIFISLPPDLSHLGIELNKALNDAQRNNSKQGNNSRIQSTAVTLAGAIDGKYNIHMDFTMDDHGNLSGIYYYDRYAEKKDTNNMKLRGTVNGNNLLVLEEYNKNEKNTGRFEIIYQKQEGVYNGKFIRYSDGKEMPCKLIVQ